MKAGDILRQRKVRTYFTGKEARGYVEFAADRERIRLNQTVFVSLLLGVERLDGNPPMDEEFALNRLGLWTEQQLIDVLGTKEARALLRKVARFAGLKREKTKKAGQQ